MGATDYYEAPGSPVENLDAETGTLTATRIFHCAWLDRYLVRNHLFSYQGRSYEYDTSIWATTCEISPYSGLPPISESAFNKRVTYEEAELRVGYKNLAGNPKDGTAGAGNISGTDFCEETLSTDLQYLSVSNKQLFWGADDPLDDGDTPVKLIPFRNYEITFHNIKNIPASWDSLLGTINTATYTSVFLSRTFAAHTLLFLGYKTSRASTTFGTAGWDATLSVAIHPNDWITYWNVDTADWANIYTEGEWVIPFYSYELADWSDLAIPATPT